jgi:hypothetical protein
VTSLFIHARSSERLAATCSTLEVHVSRTSSSREPLTARRALLDMSFLHLASPRCESCRIQLVSKGINASALLDQIGARILVNVFEIAWVSNALIGTSTAHADDAAPPLNLSSHCSRTRGRRSGCSTSYDAQPVDAHGHLREWWELHSCAPLESLSRCAPLLSSHHLSDARTASASACHRRSPSRRACPADALRLLLDACPRLATERM